MFLLCLMCLKMSAQIMTYNINLNINSNDTLQPFGVNTHSYGLSIDGEGQLFSDTAFIRVVLVDNNDKEWLVYERNSLYSTEENYQFQSAAFETAALYNIVPCSVIISLCDATFYFANIKNNCTFANKDMVASVSDSVFLTKNLQIVERINAKLSAYKKAWRADTTFLSNLKYREKKAIFGNHLPNLQGWDYYAYGFYSPLNDNTPPASNNIVKEFDWRTRHGSKNTDSYYYNDDGSGWIPRRRYGQRAAECWAFTAQYTTEAMVNLYFNRPINDELSVQDIISCSEAGTWDSGGSVKKALKYIAEEGIVGENCFHFYPRQTIPCDSPYKCEKPNEIVRILDRSEFFGGEDTIKTNLITKGALACRMKKWGHDMCMVGFGVVKAGDPILYGNFDEGNEHELVVDANSPDIGKPYYIFKQSYADYGYDRSPFCKVIIDANSHNTITIGNETYTLFTYVDAFSIEVPITSQLYDELGVACLDVDGDGYYNWGIGPKPATCPNCPDAEDCDDSSPLIGPYNEKYECVVLCNNYVYSSIPEHITGQALWGSEKYLDHDIIIDNGGTLTILNTIHMGGLTKIIVKPGGKLILDYGAVLTGLCDNMWQGIEVWGNSNTHQYAINGSYGQGYIELKNGAVIENAKCAVELWRPGDYMTTGGIIHATDAIFRNNATAVRALSYNNYHPYTHAPKNYNAYFNNCSFVVDENYIGSETFEKHIVLLVVDGIEFKGCDFSATRSVNGVDPYCKGLFTFDASFSVTSPCTTNNTPCPWEEMDHSTFTGLYSGILAFGGLSNPRTFVVREAIFSNNDYGINVLNSHFPTIIFNDFEIGGGYCDFNYGVCLKNSTSFSVEENHFHPIPNTTNSTVGVAVCNSNSINNVYRNTFDGLSVANLALGQNTEISNGMSAGRLQGLTYTCNEFDGNGYDIMALKEEGVGNIQFQQGTSALPAGNIFENSTFQIYNDGVNQIAYYYNPNGLDETPNTSMLYRVTPQSANGSNNCISHYGNNPVVKSPSEKAELAMEYLAAYNAYLDLRRLYESHMDDSDTADPTADNSPAAEMLQVGAQMAQYSHEYTLAAGDIVRSNLNDSVANPTEVRTWLGNMNDIAADRMIVSSYIQEGDSANAFTLANMLPAKHDMKGDQLTDHGCYMRLINLHQALHRSRRNIFQLTETEANLVRDIAENGLGVSQSMAEAILEQITDRSRDACFSPELPNGGDGDKGIMTHSNITEKEEKVLNVSVAPNPATTWTTVNYALPKQGTKALFTLTNALGINVLSVELEGAQGSKVLDLRGLAAGVYVYTIRYEQFTEIGKLVIEK